MSRSALGGGSICRAQRVMLEGGQRAFAKWCPYPVEAEVEGLEALREAGAPVPAILGYDDNVLVLEEVSGEPDWEGLGRSLAAVHRHTAGRFGWPRDNRIGELEQCNGYFDDWPTFYAEQRVRCHLSDPAVPRGLARRLDRACDGPLHDLLPTRPPASLIHGDLWSGNVVDGRWLVDPAVSHADREHELAFMQLFGGLPAALFRAYEEAWPVAEDYPRHRPALQLHHLLVHVRHFGGHYVDMLAGRVDALGW